MEWTLQCPPPVTGAPKNVCVRVFLPFHYLAFGETHLACFGRDGVWRRGEVAAGFEVIYTLKLDDEGCFFAHGLVNRLFGVSLLVWSFGAKHVCACSGRFVFCGVGLP